LEQGSAIFSKGTNLVVLSIAHTVERLLVRVHAHARLILLAPASTNN